MKEKKSVAGDFVQNDTTTKQKDVKKAKKNGKKPRFFKRIGRWFKETFAELKKVSWPTFGKVVKQTGVVLVVVLIFLVVITAFDVGLYSLLGLVKPSLPGLF
ncbi:MAG: preprotein translocase subunit SecE [Clostridia bacterium]|nr:preprotein translocase subunit SecE [Clostridia bacterium]